MLYPLVEASIPEHILIAWERERNSISRSTNANTHDLDLLLKFLCSEVISAERLRIAKTFCSGEKDKNKSLKLKPDTSTSVAPIPTTSTLLNQTKNDKRALNIFCLFCSKKIHRSSDCFSAQNIVFVKEKVLQRKREGKEEGITKKRRYYK